MFSSSQISPTLLHPQNLERPPTSAQGRGHLGKRRRQDKGITLLLETLSERLILLSPSPRRLTRSESCHGNSQEAVKRVEAGAKGEGLESREPKAQQHIINAAPRIHISANRITEQPSLSLGDAEIPKVNPVSGDARGGFTTPPPPDALPQG